MESKEIRQRFLNFFEKRGHVVIPSASLVPENDPSVLFNTAGMQPLVPYLLGEEHPKGKRLVDIQKCVRTGDLEEVGDNTHLTFFEMMGNWSLGDYFKKEAIEWSYELLTSKTEGFGLNPQRLYVTCFEGDENSPRDEESANIWKGIFEKNGVTGERIYFRPAEKNWWSAGANGPCGPDTEMFYDLTGELDEGMSLDEYLQADDEQRVVEIWNNVFMEYLAKDGKVVDKLKNKNVDTGSGFERVVMVLQGKSNVFETDIFVDVMDLIKSNSKNFDIKSSRIIVDHTRTATMLIADGVLPGNKDQGYVLRRLIRRAVFKMTQIDVETEVAIQILNIFINKYKEVYPNLEKTNIIEIFVGEEQKFSKTLIDGKKEYEKGADAFTLFTTYGFPLELTIELNKEKNIETDITAFQKKLEEHQGLSRTAGAGMFKGGLSGTGEMETKYHSATHLLHQALRDVLGNGVAQKGSNITSERLRFDFSFDRKITEEEKKQIEDIVNSKIAEKLPMQKVVLKKEDAMQTGALHFFGDKYGDEVSVYFIGESIENAYSKEFCGGPHVSNIGELGQFKISKEEAVSAGVRRIKAVLE